MTYGLDGEGRWNTLTDTTASQNIVTGATFYPADTTPTISLTGTTPDNDTYTIDQYTGRITKFVFTVGNTPKSLTGVLTWNVSGTLGKIAITDGFNTGGTQTCYSNNQSALGYGYDDLNRLVEFDCGSGNWGQQYSYDQYDNLTKTVISGRSGSTWNPTYSATTNHYGCGGCTYDANGDVTNDGNNVFGWNADSKLAWTASSGTPTCGSSGECITYDAFGRMVENSSGGSYNELWFTQVGTIVQMAGTTVDYGYFPAPGGGTAIINGNSASYGYMHKDWLGSARIVSSITGHGVTVDQAFSPYGEIYAQFGSTNSPYDMFAGITQNFDPLVMWDTPNRELSVVGRWLSPDPARTGWNQYAYPTNPNSFIDPSGLACYLFELRLVGRSSGDCPGNNVSFGENWNEFDQLTVAPPGAVFIDGGCWGCTSMPAGLILGQPGTTCYFALLTPCGGGPGPANTDPVVLKNPCQVQGRALPPGAYATQGQQANGSTVNFALDVAMGFPAGHYLDPQPLASGDVFQRQAYGNYTFGVYMAAAGVSLNTALSGANTYAFFFSSYSKNTPMDPNQGSLPAASVTNITNGYNAYANGTVCHN